MTTTTTTLTDDWTPSYFMEAQRQAREMPDDWPGREACCGATNAACDTSIREVFLLMTGCERCGHPRGCHS